MKKNLAVLLIYILSSSGSVIYGQNDFWDTQKKGGNCFNEVMTEQWFIDANELGLEWVRLAYDKWESEERDFLVGNASDYKVLVEKDLNQLKEVVEWAAKYNIQLVISPLSLPGSRYRQNNGNIPDSRLWSDFGYQDQAIRFWVDLARELKDYDHIAYNLINEPFPELGAGVKEHYSPGDVSKFLEWYQSVRDTPRDIYKFYSKIIKEIRKVDADKMIMLDAGWYGQPGAFCYWPSAFEDRNILYSFHMYEPYEFTSNKNFKEKNNYVYPGRAPFGKDTIYWDKNTTELYFQPFLKWVDENNIPINRIVCGEFGCMRKNVGAAEYLKDIINFLNLYGFHWAFYSFREDAWDGYDYELGAEGLGWKYWEAKEKGENPPLPWKDNELFDVIKQQF